MLTKKNIFIGNLLILLQMLLACPQGQAQLSAGIQAGYSHNHLDIDLSGRIATRSADKGGYAAELLLAYKMNRLIAVQTGIGIIQKNHTIERTGVYRGVFESYTNNYLLMPALLQWHCLEKNKFSLLVNSGIYTAFFLSSRVHGMVPNIYNSTETEPTAGGTLYLVLTPYTQKLDIGSDKNRFEFGGILGISINRQIDSHSSLTLTGNYHYAFTTQSKKDCPGLLPAYNETVLLSIGWIRAFNKIKRP